jgi:large subunit ribosomal protein L3
MQEYAPWARGSWEPGSRRCGLLAVKIGVQPLWLKNGKQLLTTMLQIQAAGPTCLPTVQAC